MAFSNLEDALPDNKIERYLTLFGNLHEPTKTVLGYALDIASYLKQAGLDEEYALFGGYAVLSHLMSVQGEDFATIWRGSTDIDMAGDKKVIQAIRSAYKVNSCNESPNLDNKLTIKLTKEGNPECKIDFYNGDFRQKFREIETNTHLGIPLKVVNPVNLIDGKLNTPESELQHAGDILGMLYVLEKRGYDNKQIANYFHQVGKVRKLQDRLKIGKQAFSTHRMGLFPSVEYMAGLERRLHRLREI